MSEADDARFSPKGISPSKEQLDIQMARVRYGLVEANAGAAKTTTLALRLAQALHRGAAPEKLLALTYTEVAVEALRQALLRIGVAAAAVKRLRLCSFDAFSRQVLLGLEGPGVIACSTDEQLKPYVLRAIERAQTLDHEPYPDALEFDGSGEGRVEGLLLDFARLKGSMALLQDEPGQHLTPSLAEERGLDYATLRIYSAYEWIRRGGHPDHPAFRAPGDATYDLARMILQDELAPGDEHPLALGLNLVLLDEMHDCNRAMFTVLTRLLHSNPRAGFLGVGDRDQVIHSANGAEAQFMGQAFDDSIGKASRFPLTATFRFDATLAKFAGQLAGKAYASLAPNPTTVELAPVSDEREMSRRVLLGVTAIRLLDEGQAKKPSKASTTRSLAVLLRQPHLSVPLESALLRAGVAYHTAGFTPFLLRREVLLLRGLQAQALQDYSAFESPQTRLAVLQAMMLFAGAYIDSEELRLQDRVAEQREVMRSVAADPAGMPAFVENHVLRSASPESRQQLQATITLLGRAAPDELKARALATLSPQALARRVLVRREDVAQVERNLAQVLTLVAEEGSVDAAFRVLHQQEARLHQMADQRALCLSSIEAAKGLEFDHVFLPGLNQGEFAVGGASPENRNLLYVAMTRAKQSLCVLYDPQRPSRYLREAGWL